MDLIKSIFSLLKERGGEMKKFLAIILALGMLAWAGSAMATPVTFEVDGPTDSYAEISYYATGDASISADLAENLDDNFFKLEDNESETIEFFTLSVDGSADTLGLFSVEANLNFDTPELDVTSTGLGVWATGSYDETSGCFVWFNPVQKFTLADGNIISITLENFVLLDGVDPTVTVHATITNLGSGTAPVPEPSTILLMGSGLLGLVGYSRKRFSKKS